MNKINLKSDLQFQNNAIVSKILAKNNSGNSTLFVIDKGEKISEHTSPFLASVFCIGGKIKINIEGNSFELIENDFIQLPENKSHSLEALEKSKFILFMLK